MDLLLIRHAIAAPAAAGQDDATRALTDEGRRRLLQAVGGLQALEVSLDHLLHSPWLRSVQTAELLRPRVTGKLEQTPLLARPPGLELIDLIAQVNRSYGGVPRATIGAVGHQPWVSELMALLLAGDLKLATNLDFRKGAVAWLRGAPEPGGMTLLGLYTPKALRLMGKKKGT